MPGPTTTSIGRATTSLMRWLGPWATPTRVPSAHRREVQITGQQGLPLKLWVYTPADRPIRGTYVFAHGLNPWGPADRRSDRFTRILARAGFVVVTPFFDSLIDLRMVGTVGEDLRLAVRHCHELPEHLPGSRPSLFGLSFGSLPALQVAARHGDCIAGAVLYGGYADPVATLRYAAGIAEPAQGVLEADALSRPAVVMSLAAEDPRVGPNVRAALRYFIEATWGREDMHELEAFEPFARQVAATLQSGEAQHFLRGCGVGPDVDGYFDELVTAGGPMLDLDPRSLLDEITCPLRVMHGMDDRVIPWTEQEKLLSGLRAHPNLRHYRTGIFDHTRVHTPLQLLARGPEALNDLATMTNMARAIAEIGHLR